MDESLNFNRLHLHFRYGNKGFFVNKKSPHDGGQGINHKKNYSGGRVPSWTALSKEWE